MGSFRYMVSTDRSTDPLYFIRRAGCHTSKGFPGRCQLLLQIIELASFSWIGGGGADLEWLT